MEEKKRSFDEFALKHIENIETPQVYGAFDLFHLALTDVNNYTMNIIYKLPKWRSTFSNARYNVEKNEVNGNRESKQQTQGILIDVHGRAGRRFKTPISRCMTKKICNKRSRKRNKFSNHTFFSYVCLFHTFDHARMLEWRLKKSRHTSKFIQRTCSLSLCMFPSIWRSNLFLS